MGRMHKGRIIPELGPRPRLQLPTSPRRSPWQPARSTPATPTTGAIASCGAATAPRPSGRATGRTAARMSGAATRKRGWATRSWTGTRIAPAPASATARHPTWRSSRGATSPPTASRSLPLPLRTTETSDPQGAEDRDALAALVDGAHAGAVVFRARDLGGAMRLDVQRARDRDVGTEAVPALGIVEADRALARHVDGGAHEDERRLVGGRVVAGLRRADAEDLHAGGDHARGGRAFLEWRLRAPRGDAAVQGLLFRGGLRAERGGEENGGECGAIHGLTPCVVDGAARGSRAARCSSHRSTPPPPAHRAGSPPRAAWSK